MKRGRHSPPRRSHGFSVAVGIAVVVGLSLVVALSTMVRQSFADATPLQPSPTVTTAAATPAGVKPVPVYAYFYQWFTSSSWDRAKQDYPLAGRYSSDDETLLRQQVLQAKATGIDGFITSWKSTVPLNRRLDRLVRVARQENLDLGVVYQALDFYRKPLPIDTIRRDMVYLVDRWGAGVTSHYYGRPVIIWTGTDQFSREDVASVRTALGDRAYLLAASRSVTGYDRIADLVDGEAYYWSSADPEAAMTRAKLLSFSDAVHANGGIWFAPASPGYDGTTLGGSRVIDRKDGRTLEASLDNAFASGPDAVAVISWNEWSENTYIEPGERYGSRELETLQSYLSHRSATPLADDLVVAQDSTVQHTGLTALQAIGVLVALAVLGGILLLVRRRRSASRARDAAAPPPASDAVDRSEELSDALPGSR